ncbi:hypothetical protein [Shewanella acanthi]|uniref:hypothetical protein n=1 Tax=Shewanella acanthi TaxID=2864212 RepID=UPI001C65C7E6|nr:hypothetical protein [Shewanella acanthi]QYJ77840.1 hypothetical protein K0H61_11990 [Shewanella acanthi]
MTNPNTSTPSNPFGVLNKSTAASFNEQKNLIKRVLKGQAAQCPSCKQSLKVILPEQVKAEQLAGIYCAKGCTDIELDMEAIAQ